MDILSRLCELLFQLLRQERKMKLYPLFYFRVGCY